MDYARKNGVTEPLGAYMPGSYESERVTYGNTNVKDELDTINSNLSANKYGAVVDLTAYTASNPYVTPCDGYATAYIDDGQPNLSYVKTTILGSTGFTSPPLMVGGGTTYGTREMCYVKKGFRLYGQISGGTGQSTFYPLEN